MSEEISVRPTAPDIWERTTELRWSHGGRFFPGTTMYGTPKLQQLWRNTATGETEWRDVEVVG